MENRQEFQERIHLHPPIQSSQALKFRRAIIFLSLRKQLSIVCLFLLNFQSETQDEIFGTVEPHTVWGLSKCLKQFITIAYEYMFSLSLSRAHLCKIVVMLKYNINHENLSVFIITPSKIFTKFKSNIKWFIL